MNLVYKIMEVVLLPVVLVYFAYFGWLKSSIRNPFQIRDAYFEAQFSGDEDEY